jgi:hypothetical protein
MPRPRLPVRRPLHAAIASGLLFLAAAGPLAAAPARAADGDAEALRQRIKAAVEELAQEQRAVNRAFAPVRRGAPADTARWRVLDDLHAAVGAVAATAAELDAAVARLSAGEGFEPEVRRSVLRARQARADSLAAAAAALAARPWRPRLPADAEEARLAVARLAREAKEAADLSVAASDDLAYAVGVTEGVGPRSLSLSLVGILVVFSVLALISALVALIRRLDDDWQGREAQTETAALQKDPTIDETTAVLIAAACATVITGRHRVRRIRRLLSPRTKRTPWSAQGRLILQGSHAVERKHG